MSLVQLPGQRGASSPSREQGLSSVVSSGAEGTAPRGVEHSLVNVHTDLGSTGHELQSKVCQNPQGPHDSGCCGVSAPALAPGATSKGNTQLHGRPGWQGQVPLDTLQLRTLRTCFWPRCLVLPLAWALFFWHEPKQMGIWIVS